MSYNPLNPNGQATSANSAPVVIASDQSSVPVTLSSLPLPSGGATSANQTNGTQQSQVTDGTNVANVLSPGTANSSGNALLSAPTSYSVTFSTTTVQNVATIDAGNYRWVSVQINAQGTSSTVTFQVSNDNINWSNNALISAGANNGSANSTTSTGNYHGPIAGRYFRLSVSGITAGTTSGIVQFSSATTALASMAVLQVGNWSTRTQDGTGNAISSTSGSLNVNLSPTTTGGLTSATGSIGATATTVKASAGQVYGWYIFNNNTAQSYVQFFNTASGSVTLGTTAPVYSLGIPANSGANAFIPPGIAHSTAITIAITTTRAGATTPTNTVDYNIFYN
jgi:hypothetical protein